MTEGLTHWTKSKLVGGRLTHVVVESTTFGIIATNGMVGLHPRCGMIGRFVQSSRVGSSNRTAGAVETGGFRPPTYTLDWDEPSIVGP